MSQIFVQALILLLGLACGLFMILVAIGHDRLPRHTRRTRRHSR